MKAAKYEVVTHPVSRIGTIDIGQLGLRKHHIAGLLEIDVTETISEVRTRRTRGQEVSFFAWMVKAIATAIAEDPGVHALQGRKHRTVVYKDVDVSVMVEKEISGDRVPLPLLIRQTSEKTVEAIHAEIRAAQREKVQDESGYVLAQRGPSRSVMRIYYTLPRRLRLLVLNWLMRSPYRRKAMMGTVMITSVRSAGHLAGWIIPKSVHNLCFALGSIVKKPWVIAKRIEILIGAYYT